MIISKTLTEFLFLVEVVIIHSGTGKMVARFYQLQLINISTYLLESYHLILALITGLFGQKLKIKSLLMI